MSSPPTREERGDFRRWISHSHGEAAAHAFDVWADALEAERDKIKDVLRGAWKTRKILEEWVLRLEGGGKLTIVERMMWMEILIEEDKQLPFEEVLDRMTQSRDHYRAEALRQEREKLELVKEACDCRGLGYYMARGNEGDTPCHTCHHPRARIAAIDEELAGLAHEKAIQEQRDGTLTPGEEVRAKYRNARPSPGPGGAREGEPG